MALIILVQATAIFLWRLFQVVVAVGACLVLEPIFTFLWWEVFRPSLFPF